MKKAELEAKGVNFGNIKYPFGDANIITQFWAAKKVEAEDYSTRIRMDVYMPRKNRIVGMSMRRSNFDTLFLHASGTACLRS